MIPLTLPCTVERRPMNTPQLSVVNPKETIWFDSVAELAALHDIPVITPDNPNTPEVIEQIRALQPDFFFHYITARCSSANCWKFRKAAR
jgi:hypothetical protein